MYIMEFIFISVVYLIHFMHVSERTGEKWLFILDLIDQSTALNKLFIKDIWRGNVHTIHIRMYRETKAQSLRIPICSSMFLHL